MLERSLDRQNSPSPSRNDEQSRAGLQKDKSANANAAHTRDSRHERSETVDATWDAFEKRSARANLDWQDATRQDQAALSAPWGMNEAAEKSLKRAFEEVCQQADKTKEAIDASERALAERQLAERDNSSRQDEQPPDNDLSNRQKQERLDVAASRVALSKELSQARGEIADARRNAGAESAQTVNETVQKLQAHALAMAAQSVESQVQAAKDEMTLRHGKQKQFWETFRPGDKEQQQNVAASQQRERKALADDAQALRSQLETIRRAVEQQGKNSNIDNLAALQEKARALTLSKTQAVRESNLFYDFDHYQPQSKYKELSNKASNLGFLAADENRRKGKTEFENLPDLKQAVALTDAIKAGEDATRKLVSDMLGSLRFSEVTELNVLWQRASANETRSYSDSQSAFRKLIGSNNEKESAEVRQAADTLRHALKVAGVDVIATGDSFRLRLDDTSYRR